jgi:hypothetical protein
MANFELRPYQGATAKHVRKKSQPQRFACPCGCGRSAWANQPRSVRDGGLRRT